MKDSAKEVADERLLRPRRYHRRIGSLMLILAGIQGMTLTAGLAIVVTSSQGNCKVGSEDSSECQLGSLKSGESASIQVKTVAEAHGPLIDSVSVSGDQHDSNPTNNTAIEETIVMGPDIQEDLASLVVTKIDSIEPVASGQSVTYTIEVVSNGSADATGVMLSDKLPVHSVEFVWAKASHGSCTEGFLSVDCEIGSLKSGAKATVSINIKPFSVGAIRNSVCVDGRQFDPDLGNNCDDEDTVRDGSCGDQDRR